MKQVFLSQVFLSLLFNSVGDARTFNVRKNVLRADRVSMQQNRKWIERTPKIGEHENDNREQYRRETTEKKLIWSRKDIFRRDEWLEGIRRWLRDATMKPKHWYQSYNLLHELLWITARIQMSWKKVGPNWFHCNTWMCTILKLIRERDIMRSGRGDMEIMKLCIKRHQLQYPFHTKLQSFLSASFVSMRKMLNISHPRHTLLSSLVDFQLAH